MAYIRLMEYEWSENPHEVDYYVPDSWDVTVYHIAGQKKPVLTPVQISSAVASPIGSPRIRDLAKGKKKVCILFDDLSRGTPTYALIPAVLAELKAGGIADNQIEFICAQGNHQISDRSLVARKVGEDIVTKYPVFFHVPFYNCTPLGKTSFGTKIEINNEVLSCDLRIAIQATTPHATYGFGGGGKIVMPGISSLESVYDHHGVTHKRFREMLRRTPDAAGVFEGNPQPKDAMEIAKKAGIDFVVNCLLNETGSVTDIFAGEIQAAHKAAVAVGKEHYQVPDIRDADIAIANAYCKSTEALHATAAAYIAVKRTGGTALTIANTHQGQIMHYLSGAWGVSSGGRNGPVRGSTVPPWINHCIFYTEFPEARNRFRFAEKDLPRVHFATNWTEVVSKLIEWHGFDTKVAVFPDGTNQYTIQPEYEEPIILE
ncbi:MAG: Lar protein [Dehalococcoidales bacterium]|nr:Lar protein [Dehalococcoidales bacterium]